jgi:hypothetical protein
MSSALALRAQIGATLANRIPIRANARAANNMPGRVHRGSDGR